MEIKGISEEFDDKEARGLLENYWFSAPGSVVPPIIEVGTFESSLQARLSGLCVPYESEQGQRGVFVDDADVFQTKYGVQFCDLDVAKTVMETLSINLFPKNVDKITQRLRYFPNNVLDFSKGKVVTGAPIHCDQKVEEGWIGFDGQMCTSPPGPTIFRVHPNHPDLDISFRHVVQDNELRQSRGNQIKAVRAGVTWAEERMQEFGVEIYRAPPVKIIITPNLPHRTTGILPKDPMPAPKEMSADRKLLLYMARAALRR